MPIELIIAAIVIGLLIGGLFIIKSKKEDKPRQAPPAPIVVPVQSWGPAIFPAAEDYIAWQKRNNFPVSDGEPIPRAVALADMQFVFNSVMGMMTYVADDGPHDYTGDLPMSAGDCEDFAIMFRYRALEAGIPRNCMRMVHVRTETGGWHAVLGIWTTSGLYVLDQRKGIKAGPWPYASAGYLEGHFEAGDKWGALQ